jgi:hypothetical protein
MNNIDKIASLMLQISTAKAFDIHTNIKLAQINIMLIKALKTNNTNELKSIYNKLKNIFDKMKPL